MHRHGGRFCRDLRGRPGTANARPAAATHVHPNGRSLGAADMAMAIKAGRPHRAGGKLSHSVLDIMLATLESSERGEFVAIDTTGVERPAMMDVAGMV